MFRGFEGFGVFVAVRVMRSANIGSVVIGIEQIPFKPSFWRDLRNQSRDNPEPENPKPE